MSSTCVAIVVALLCHCPVVLGSLLLPSSSLLTATCGCHRGMAVKKKLEVGNALEILYLGALRGSHVSQNHGVPRDLTTGTCCKPYTDSTLSLFHLFLCVSRAGVDLENIVQRSHSVLQEKPGVL